MSEAPSRRIALSRKSSRCNRIKITKRMTMPAVASGGSTVPAIL